MTLRACVVCGRTTQGPRCAIHALPEPRNTYAYQKARAIVRAQANVCWICGLPATVDDPMTADHVIAVANGGSSHLSNLRGAHRSCNSRRGSSA